MKQVYHYDYDCDIRILIQPSLINFLIKNITHHKAMKHLNEPTNKAHVDKPYQLGLAGLQY